MRCVTALGVSALLLAAVPSVRAAESALPRYNLEPGQVLSYSVSIAADDGSDLRGDATWKCYVVEKKDDAFTLVALYSFAYYQGKQTTPMHKSSEVSSIILHSDGRFEPDAQAMQADFREIFPPLPADGKGLDGAYTVRYGDDVEVKARVTSRTEAACNFELGQVSPSDKVYLSTKSGSAVFDPARRLMTSREIRMTSEWSGKQSGTTKVALTSVKNADPAQVQRLKADFERQRGALAAYREAVSALPADGMAMQRAAEARALLEKAAGEIQSADLKAPLESAIERHAETVQYQREQAKREDAVVNHAAAAWTLPRIPDGKEISLADLKGKVVVLDFWYRGCGWCIRAMPQINGLAKDYAGKDVIVLGMNTDSKQEDATFVIDKMDLRYDTMKTPRDLPGKYGVRGFPTLAVIDREGVLRKLHVGYSPTLRKDIGEVLDRLLSAPSAKSDQGGN